MLIIPAGKAQSLLFNEYLASAQFRLGGELPELVQGGGGRLSNWKVFCYKPS